MSKYKIIPRVYLINQAGVVECNYDSLDEAAEYLCPLRYKIAIGEHHGEIAYDPWDLWRRHRKLTHYDYILRDDRGRHLSWRDLDAAWDRLHPRRSFSWRRVHPDHAPGGKHYRRAPVEDVRCRRGGRGYGYRRGHATMREWSETEMLLRDEELRDYPGLVRRKRREVLKYVNDWDGPYRSDWNDRSWKRHRRSQWKTT